MTAMANGRQTLHDQMIHDLFEDFLAQVRKPEDAPDNWEPSPQDSVICHYYQELVGHGFRMQVRKLWLEVGESGGKAELVQYLAHCLWREYRFQPVVTGRPELIEPLMHVRAASRRAADGAASGRGVGRGPGMKGRVSGNAGKRQVGKSIREEMTMLSRADASTLRLRGVTDARLRALVDAMLDCNAAESSVRVAESLRVHELDERIAWKGLPALGGDVERQRMRKDLETAFGKGCEPPRPRDGMDPRDDHDFRNRMDAAVYAAMDKVARQWFGNCGCSLSAEDADGRYDGPVRVVDIPVGLIAMWGERFDGKRSAAAPATSAESEDAFRLYRALSGGGADRRRVTVPLARRLDEGDALYALGSDLVMRQLWARRQLAVRTAKRLRSQPVPACPSLADQNRGYVSDERERQSTVPAIQRGAADRLVLNARDRDCVLAIVRHDVQGRQQGDQVVSGIGFAARTGDTGAGRMDLTIAFHPARTVLDVRAETPGTVDEMGQVIQAVDGNGSWRNLYADTNGFAPDDCPERYRRFFEE